jgi:hypothetical protein
MQPSPQPVTAGIITVNGKQITIATTTRCKPFLITSRCHRHGEVTGSYDAATDTHHPFQRQSDRAGEARRIRAISCKSPGSTTTAPARSPAPRLGVIKQAAALSSANIRDGDL